MTDITKRLAEALRELMCQRGVKLYAEGFVQERALTALADFDRTAAQEANVQGGELLIVHGDKVIGIAGDIAGHTAAPHPTPAPPADKTTPQTSRTHDGKEFIDEPNAPLPEGKECLACNGTGRRTQVAFAPAPASGEVTDDDRYFLRQAGRILKTKPNLDALGDRLLSIETKFALSRPAESIHPTPAPASGEVTDGCPCLSTTPCDPMCTCVEPMSSRGCSRCCKYGSEEQRAAMAEHLAALEASHRARQGERKKTCTHCNGAGCPYCHGEGDVYVPNAVDEEAYRSASIGDARMVIEVFHRMLRKDAPEPHYLVDDAMMNALRHIGAVIPTAAPVPADEGEKK